MEPNQTSFTVTIQRNDPKDEKGFPVTKKVYEQTVESLYIPDIIAVVNGLKTCEDEENETKMPNPQEACKRPDVDMSNEIKKGN